jgi:hypothetical protein
MVSGVPDSVTIAYRQKGHRFICDICGAADTAKTTKTIGGIRRHRQRSHQEESHSQDGSLLLITHTYPMLGQEWTPSTPMDPHPGPPRELPPRTVRPETQPKDIDPRKETTVNISVTLSGTLTLSEAAELLSLVQRSKK